MFRLPFLAVVFWLSVGAGIGWWFHSLHIESRRSIDSAQTENDALARSFADDVIPQDLTSDNSTAEEYKKILTLHEAAAHRHEWTKKEREVLRNTANHLIQNDPGEAETMLNRWLANDQYNPGAMFLLAKTYIQTLQYDKALSTILTLKFYVQDDIPTADIDALIVEIETKYAALLRETGAVATLLEMYRKLISYFPDAAEYYYKLAEIQHDLDLNYEALDSLNYAIYDPIWRSQAQKLAQKIQLHLELGDKVEVPLQQRDGHFFVDASINGVGGITLLLDTGASVCVLRPQAARQIGLPEDSEKNTIVTMVSGVANAPAVTIDSLAVGEAQLNNVLANILEMPPGIDSDGLLGMNFLSRFDFFIDQDKAMLYLGSR